MRTSNRSGFRHCLRKCRRNQLEPPCTDPYARWCGRGRRVTAAPMPIMDFTGLTFSVIYSFTEFIGFIEFTRNFSQNCNQLVVLHDTSGMAALGYTIVLSQSACTATPAPSAELQRNP